MATVRRGLIRVLIVLSVIWLPVAALIYNNGRYREGRGHVWVTDPWDWAGCLELSLPPIVLAWALFFAGVWIVRGFKGK